ncbi:MAG: radical SAM protein [Chloroflexales bacterium]
MTRSPLRVLLAQLPVPNNPALNTPLAAGYLKAYAEAHGLGERVVIDILPRAIADDAGDAALAAEIVERAPDLLGLSLYTWNSERSLEVARRVRLRLPTMIVVVGGPEVQADNPWVLAHPAVSVAVIGEGEQIFAELLVWAETALPGIPFDRFKRAMCGEGQLPLRDLAVVPSPYLAGHLELPPDGMLMVEISRWCPYTCSFCLYGRNMGPRLGSRYFSLERVLAEVAWGRERGVRRIHFVEANLNLLPIFWPLMRALAELNADRQISFYAELRGEHLSAAAVAALDAANVRVVEVGLQTANPAALRATSRRTDLAKWAAGTRRLYAAGIEVFLDVILGLPEDDVAGVAATLTFIAGESLGPYDIFMLQGLPGTAVRREAAQRGMTFQDRPPYYVLGTDRLPYAELRRLRRELKLGAGIDPDAVEGVPGPRADALSGKRRATDDERYIRHLRIEGEFVAERSSFVDSLATHVDVILPAERLAQAAPLLAGWVAANPSTLFDVYLEVADEPPGADALRGWRAGLPYTPGYLDRAAVYAADQPAPAHVRVSPRLWLVLPWVVQVEPDDYAGVAGVIWRYELEAGQVPPLGAWRTAGGAGVALSFADGWDDVGRAAALANAEAWATEQGRRIFAVS